MAIRLRNAPNITATCDPSQVNVLSPVQFTRSSPCQPVLAPVAYGDIPPPRRHFLPLWGYVCEHPKMLLYSPQQQRLQILL